MKFSTLLVDLDRTILDFDKAEESALVATFEKFDIPFSQDVLALYRRNNERHWALYEQGKIVMDQIDVGRFVDTLQQLGLSRDVYAVSDFYQHQLDFGYQLCPNAMQALQALYGKCKLYAVTNGAIRTQKQRLRGTGLDKLFSDVFISDEVGYSKPQKQFFEYALAHIEEKDKSKILVVGDSLKIDIMGAKQVNLPTCWYNPSKNKLSHSADYEIANLMELIDIVK